MTGPERSGGVASSVDVDDARGWVGAKIDEIGGAGIGRIESLLVDARGGEPTWVIVRLRRFGRRCAIPVEFVAVAVGRAWVPFSREVIVAASDFDPSGGLSCGDERTVAGRYGVPAGSGRRAELGDRDDEEPGSVPIG